MTKGAFGMPKSVKLTDHLDHRPGRGRARRGGRIMLAGAIPIAMALAATGTAHAGEQHAAVIADQPGVTSPEQSGTAPPPPPPAPTPEQPVYYEQPPEVRNAPSRPAPPPEEPAAPVRVEDLHLPEPVPPVAPIEPPENTIRIGQWQALSPEWLPPEARDTINTVAANAEAHVATALDSVGIPAGRSDRVSGATMAGAAVGGAAGAVAAGAPAAAAGAVVGGLIGGTIGGIAGAAIGTVVPVPVVGTVTSGVAGTALGAAVGAAVGAVVAGVPAAAVGAVAAGTVGAGFGAGVGVGQP
ncbi:hypothetical protein [Nocardia rhamnosiphila]|uniref:Uncharacterized protein n=1 Tax=Nocardia rhamnosiphila TaxID=426716 RepID=A0ABV2WIU8_9NOCA